MIAYLQPTVVEETIRDGLFDPGWAERALRSVRDIRVHNAKGFYLLSNLSSGATYEQDSGEFVLHAVRKIEETCWKRVADARKLAKPG
jgi:hypothetical protein